MKEYTFSFGNDEMSENPSSLVRYDVVSPYHNSLIKLEVIVLSLRM